MKKRADHIISLLPDYFNGNLRSEDIKKIKDWIEKKEENRRIFDEIRDIWFALNSEKEQKKFNKINAWETYNNWIESNDQKRKLTHKVLSVIKYASIIILTLLISHYASILPNIKPIHTKPFIAEAPKGQTSVITLYDGTVVKLNSGSKLICDNYNDLYERHVTLEGEGYFKVKYNPDLPFIVNVKNIKIKVYGTEFNITGYNDNNFVKTILIKGKIGITLSNGKEYILKPNEMFKVNNKQNISIDSVNASEAVTWTKGYYAFKNETFKNISKHIERMFNVNVIFEKPGLENERYTGRISKSDHINDVMQKIKMTSAYSFNYTIKDSVIHIYKNN